MDIATIVGVMAGMVLLVYTVMSTPGSSFGMFVNYPSLAVVFGGALASCLISAPLSRITATVKVLRNAFLCRRHSVADLIRDLVHYAEVARRDGILALDRLSNEMEDAFLARSVRLAVDGTDPERMQEVLAAELEAVAERHANGRRVFELMGKYAPAFGMIGTLIGLIVMLGNMQDPDAIGPGMAVALITTLYGALAANFLFLPIADKLQYRSREELAVKELIILGVVSIQSGDNPRVVEQKLKAFLPPAMREAAEREEEARQAA